MRKRVTIRDVADRAEVGVGTVSRVLNGHPKVSDDTRQRIESVIADLDYHPHFAARHMRTANSQTFGFITDQIATTPYAVKLIQGAQDAAFQNDMLLLIINTEGNPALEADAVKLMLERHVEGIIFATMYPRIVTLPPAIHQLPAVLLDCMVADGALPSVVPDEYGGGYLATKTLIENGHERIAFINLHQESLAAKGRLRGYRAALQDHGLSNGDRYLRQGTDWADSGYQRAYDLMSLATPPTAIFCGTDRIAMGVYDALKEMNRRIPDDISVIGFDNQEIIAAYLRPPLSTMEVPFYKMGRFAIEHLLSGSDEKVQKQMACPFIERESVRSI